MTGHSAPASAARSRMARHPLMARAAQQDSDHARIRLMSVSVNKGAPPMRLILATATPATATLALAALLAGCGPAILPGETDPREPAAVCAEQSALATQGRADGRAIVIDCPAR